MTVGGKHDMHRQLTEAEYQRLMRWQRRMVRLFIGAMIALLALLSLTLVFGFRQSLINYLFPILIIVFVIPGILLQFSERCPNCDHRLGLQTRLILPENCKRCGVSLREHH